MLVPELQHRTRNLIAVVQSTMGVTLRSHPAQRLRTRLPRAAKELARVQDPLSRPDDGDRIAFGELVRTELSAPGAVDAQGQGARVALEGPAGVRLRSGSVQTLALALHELATNPAKRGTLAGANGRLLVRRRVLRGAATGGAAPRLEVEWVESGVAMPSARLAPRGGGHGRELIEPALPYQLGAETAYELGRDGVRRIITLPISSTAG